jgi:hypothetical protein
VKKYFVIAMLMSNVAFAAKAKVFFIEPKNDAQVESTFKVKMGVEGMKVCPANKETADKACGHHHLIVDGKPVATHEIVPADATHIHYGKEQTETELKLAKGKHTLTLQFGDYAHHSYGPDLAATITVDVK